jgi:hypothetical protein
MQTRATSACNLHLRHDFHVRVQTGLHSLAFQNVGCSIRACQAVQELVQHSQELRALHLYNNMSDNEGAVAIGQVRPQPNTMRTNQVVQC